MTTHKPIQPNSIVLSVDSAAWQFHADKIRFVPEIARRTKKGSFGAFPIAAEVHLSTECGLRCSVCSYKRRNVMAATLSLAEVVAVLEWLGSAGTHSVLFSGGGEPLSWPHWASLLAATERMNSPLLLSLATNGLGLADSPVLDGLTAFDTIQVSINCHDEAFLSETRGRGHRACLERSLAALFAKRPPSVQCTAKVVVGRANYARWKESAKVATSWPFDAVVLKVAGAFEGRRGLALNDAELTQFAASVRHYPWPVGYTAKFDGFASGPEVAPAPLAQGGSGCFAISCGLYVLLRADGSVFLCVASADDDQASIGSIRGSTISELWLGHRHTAVVDLLDRKYRHGHCRAEVCRHRGYGLRLDDPDAGQVPSKRTLALL